MEKPIISLAVSIMIFSFSPAHTFTLFVENGIDRPGCDFKNFVLPAQIREIVPKRLVSARMHVLLMPTVRVGALMLERAQVRAS
jgi:hypothetical protein